MDPNIIAAATTCAAVSTLFKSFDGPLETIKNHWYCLYGYKSDLERKKVEVLVEKEVNDYKAEIQNEVNKIPADKRTISNFSVIMQTFDASKNFIYEKDLRKMFAKLIASACNSDTTYLTHPAFPFIISQLSPFEAKILSETNILKGDLPCCKIRFQEVGKNDDNKKFSAITLGRDVIRQFIIFDNINISHDEINLYKSLLDNLTRLNLCEVPESYELSDESAYLKYLQIPSLNTYLSNYIKEYGTDETEEKNREDIRFIKKTSKPTDFGKLFYKICIQDD